MHASSAPGATTSVVDLVGDVFRRHRTGVLMLGGAHQGRRLYFVDGQLHLVKNHPLAQRLARFLQTERRFGTQEIDLRKTFDTGDVRSQLGFGVEEEIDLGPQNLPPKAQSEIKTLLRRVAGFLEKLEPGSFEFRDGAAKLPEGLVGPLPTIFLVMDLAARFADRSHLLSVLGGDEAQLVATRNPEDLTSSVWIEPEDAFLLSRLVGPVTLRGVLRQTVGDPEATIATLSRLLSVYLVQPYSREEPPSATKPSIPVLPVSSGVGLRPAGIVTPGRLGVFLERIQTSLTEEPLDLAPQEHRRQLAELLSSLGDKNLYEVLEVPVDAGTEQVHVGFQTLARWVHPGHAEVLGLQGKSEALAVLFERATEAYLVLSDPDERKAYNRKMDLSVKPEEDEQDPEEIDRRLAREYFQMSVRAYGTDDFQTAHELMKDAVRRHPRAEYWDLLGQVQIKNPNWLEEAVQSFRESVALEPTSAEYRLALADACREIGYDSEAELQYQEILDREPRHPEAEAALRSLKGGSSGASGGGLLSWLRRLFGGRRAA